MSLMLSTGLLLAYSGMLGLCLGLERHYKQVWQRVPGPRLRRALRIGGWLALGGSFAASVVAWGWAMGPIGWFGLMSLAGLGLVLLLPYRAKAAVWLAVVGLPLLGVVRML
ncbi:DUF3325 domain-containing protein [Pseudomonas sp. 148P]|uniref:DUF3325 domain-containing protein n=1 Tax=Pseudomonas ulcerans TaxID=3115852 RepID=A0ABU7HN81_9PSED|nr:MULTISPECIES: DUF3325 domain-containing protein [unclassified Pseudomonas]MEE1922518.1 DUF3325 domain-containing protein [Pseudomonas sp. 147P]MEE1932992.1 DUF3325 domain-containing protein [Pseudomonas sp. 148P]